MSAKIISAFPGIGKSYATSKIPGALDSDSSHFSWAAPGMRNPNFPENYIKHIRDNMETASYIFVSSHQEVRDALANAGIDYLLVYPDPKIKEEYLKRYIDRGSPESFVQLLDKNWDAWIQSCINDRNAIAHYILPAKKFIIDILK
jgi:hypothetical protein